MSTDTDLPTTDLAGEAHIALARGTWEVARAWFEEALDREETPAALEGLGLAAWWGSDAAVAFDAHRRAYRLYRARGDRRGAARMATFHAIDYFTFRNAHAICNGWLQRAHRLIDGLDPCPEHALLAERAETQHFIAEIDLAACRALLGRTAQMADTCFGMPVDPDDQIGGLHALMKEFQSTKTFVTLRAVAIVDRAMTLSGGAGYLAGSRLAQLYRDVRAGPLMQPFSPNEAFEYIGKVTLDQEPALDM